MSKITIGFSRPKTKKLFSEAIMLFDGFDASHTYLQFEDSHHDLTLIYHAKGSNLHFMSKEVFDKENKTVYTFEIDLDKAKKHEVVTYLLKNAGKPYAVMQIVGIALDILCKKLFRFSIKNLFSKGRKSMICSEVVAYVLKMSGLKVKYNLDTITPKEVYDVCKQQLK